jgi:hypothetical protein
MALNDYTKWFTGEAFDRALILESTIKIGQLKLGS